MLESFNTKLGMQYQRLSAEERAQRGILGRLVGPMASYTKATRNGRLYTEELWEKVFSNPIMKEKIKNHCVFGELGHPEDRNEIDMEKIAICLSATPKKGNDGNLHGIFDILDTPNGRILKTMCDYGCNIGVSSRGTGEVNEDWNGTETVDPDSYECECWDAVLLPANIDARPTYITESLDTSKKSLKMALTEALNSADTNSRRIMQEALDNLEIDYNTEEEVPTSESVENIEEPQAEDDTTVAAEDNGAEMVEALQEALSSKIELEKQVKTLQEKLSVCYTKEARYSNVLSKTKTELAQAISDKEELAKLNESLNTKVNDLSTALDQATITIEKQTQKIVGVKTQLKENMSSKTALTEDVSSLKSTIKSLNEDINGKDMRIKSLNESLTSLQENFNKATKDHDKQINSLKEELQKSNVQTRTLQEQLEEVKKDSKIIKSQATAKITKAEQLTEKYKTVAKTAVDKYIEARAQRLGVKAEDIKSKLNENFSFNDIDKVCESVQQYKLNINSLPFTTDRPVKMKITESKKPSITSIQPDDRFDDDIDDTLKNFI